MPTPPIRTAVYAPPIGRDVDAWRRRLRLLDESGLTAVSVSDHFQAGVQDPVATLAALATSTRRLRLMALVLCNDYRHPVITHHAMATVDALSGGRLDLGLGAGYLAAEYAAAGLPFDPPGLRVDRLTESVDLVKALFGGRPVHHSGPHYTVSGLTGSPAPVQTPHPSLVIGGGGKRMLALAGRHAQIAGIHSNLGHGTAYDAAVIEDMVPERMAAKIGWVREAAERAGRDPDGLSYLSVTWTCRVVDSPRRTPAALAEVCRAYGVDPEVGRRSTGLLVGTVEECVEQLRQRQRDLGLDYVDFGAADPSTVAPLAAALAAPDAGL